MSAFAGAAWLALQGAAPDVIHANFFLSGWVGLQLRRSLGAPLVTSFHGLGLVRQQHQREADRFRPERVGIERLLAQQSDRVVAA